MAETYVLTEEQIGQFWAQLMEMSLSGRRLGVEQEKLVVWIFLDQFSHRLPNSALSAKKRSEIAARKQSHFSQNLTPLQSNALDLCRDLLFVFKSLERRL